MSITNVLSADYLSSGTAVVMTRAIGTFVFDAVTRETHQSRLKLTENPIETGAAIADHAVLEPQEITLNGIMVGYEPPNYLRPLTDAVPDEVKTLPLPLTVHAVTAQAMNMANRYLSTVEQIADATARMIAPFVPDYLGFSLDGAATFDRVSKAQNELQNLQKRGETLTVQTGTRLYENMMLLNIGVTQVADGSAEFTLMLREIFVVESQRASGISAPETRQMGKTQPAKANVSVLKDIFT